jgi:hypothetical protein
MSAATPPSRRLTCFFKTENANGEIIPDLSNNASEKVYLEQEPGKKSSFLLEPDTSITPFYTVEKPPNVIIEYENPQAAVPKDSTFFLGAFQMVSTAKTVEIYLTDVEGKESYLTTSKGISFNKEDKTASWYKTICVVPGGPRPILRLRIKLLSLRPVDASTAKLQFMKLTARVAETPSPQPSSAQVSGNAMSPPSGAFTPVSAAASTSSANSSESAKPKSVFFATQEPVKPEPRQLPPANAAAPSAGVTQSDLGAAMAGMSFMARSTEKGIEEALDEQTKRLERSFGSCFMRMEQHLQFLQRHLIVQQQLIQESQETMELQQKTIEEQNNQIRTLVKQQDDLKIRVQSLQADMSIVRYHRLDTSSNMQGRKRDVVEPEEEKEEPLAPPVVEIGTKVRDIDEDEDDGISGIADNSMEEPREDRDVQLENINLKKLIQRTQREIEARPVTCGPSFPQQSLSCGMPSIAQKPLSCTVPVLPDDEVLFRGMMLTDEELLYQRMSQLRASRDAEDNFEPVSAPAPPPPPEIDDEVADNTLAEEPEEVAHVNIEVTLMDDGDEDEEELEDGEHVEEDTAAKIDEDEPRAPPSVDDLLAEPEDDDLDYCQDGDATVAAANIRKNSGFRAMDEKKEMDPVDTPDIANLLLKGQPQDIAPETPACFDTHGFPCVSGSSSTPTL